jgi:xanthine dehydrogenase accessory factor
VLHEHRLTEELAWNTGLVCGGTMWILAERGEDALWCGDFDALPGAVAAARGGLPMAFVTRISRGGRKTEGCFEARTVVLAGGRMIGTIGDAAAIERARDAALDQMKVGTPRLVAIDEWQDLLIEPVTSRPRLVVAGGGHVAKAIARQARLLDFDVTILEDRPEFADPGRFDGAAVLTGPVPETIESLQYDSQSYLVIATRGHKLDADCVLAAVKTRVPYIGLLGSRRKTVLVETMLRDAGVAEDRIAVIHAPIGLDLGGRTPAEIALSILAEITRIRYDGTGLSLGMKD